MRKKSWVMMKDKKYHYQINRKALCGAVIPKNAKESKKQSAHDCCLDCLIKFYILKEEEKKGNK